MSSNFSLLISRISETNVQFQQEAVKSIDKLLTVRNWLIGAYIVEYEQNGADKAEYGRKLEEKLAERIDQKGLSARNLKLFKQFYNTYPQIVQTLSALSVLPEETVQTVSASLTNKNKNIADGEVPTIQLIENLSFSHFVELLKIEDAIKRQFYEVQVIKSALSVRELKRQIDSLTYERTVAASDKEKVLASLQDHQDKQIPTGIVKTPYIFDFLGLSDATLGSESDLENALLADLKNFMLELGHGFCFEAQQKRIVIGGEYFFIDLVFYHRILKCHVLIELKIEGFNHAHVGQLNTYLHYFKQNVQEITDNPPIGILLCTNKNDELVEYALGGMDQNLFVSTYQTVLPSPDELKLFLQEEKRKLED